MHLTKVSRKYIYSILAEEENIINITISYTLLYKIFLCPNHISVTNFI